MESNYICCSQHKESLVKCQDCLKNQEFTIALINLNKHLHEKKAKIQTEIDSLQSILNLSEDKIKKTSFQCTNPADKISHPKSSPLTEYFLNLILPQDFFLIINREDYVVAFMIQSKFIPLVLKCQSCSNDMHIYYYSYAGYAYSCCLCMSKIKIKSTTIFRKSPLTLEKGLLFVFLWVLGVRDLEISYFLEISKLYTSRFSRNLRQLSGKEYYKNVPKFSGVVELDELDFIKKKIEIGKSKSERKWIIIIVERETKEAYMEHIPSRSKEIIIPIIQRICMPGTIIITRAWGGYGRLEDLGFCHYTYDKFQGFRDPHNRHIHHSNLKISFTWLKIQIKTKNRSCKFLNEYIAEWLWRKKISAHISREASLSFLFKAALNLISNRR